MMKPKLIRVTTIPISMNILLRNQLAFLTDYFNVIGVTSKDDKHFAEIVEREKISMVAIELTRSITPFKDLKALLKMIILFKKERPWIVHSHTPKVGLIAMVASKITGVPVRLHTVAGMPMMEAGLLRKSVLKITEKITYSCATVVLPNSHGLQQYIIKNQLASPPKLKVIGNGSSNGIDLEYFSVDHYKDLNTKRNEIRSSWGIAEHDFVFCFVGRIVKDKGLKELVNAFLKISEFDIKKRTVKNPKLLLIGPMVSGRDKLDSFTGNQIKHHPDIIYAGRHDDIRPFLLASDVFVFPSYREGFPNAVMQAGAMGLPCIVSDINGCNEIIIHGENGLIVPPKNSTRLFEAMLLLMNDERLRTKLAKNARPMIASRFEQKAFWTELLKTYQKCMEESKLPYEHA